MSKGFDVRGFVMPEGIKLKGESLTIRGALNGKIFKREDYLNIKRILVRGRPGYLSKGGKPYDDLEAGKSFAAELKSGAIPELK